jgi:hypothetical protein
MTDRPPDPLGGVGGNAFERRQHLRTLEALVYQGWQIPPEVFASIPKALRDIADSTEQSTRDRIRASEALSHLAQQMADAAVQLDRINRLDAGLATDRTEVLSSLNDAQLAAVAASLLPAPKPAPCLPPAAEPPKPAPKRKRRG